MPTRMWLDYGPDIEVIRTQMSLEPPDDGSIHVEQDGERITAVSWTHNGRRCSVSTAIVASVPH